MTCSREELTTLLRDAITKQGLSQARAARDASEETGLKIRQQHVSRALKETTGRLDYVRVALAGLLLGGTWHRDTRFRKES